MAAENEQLRLIANKVIKNAGLSDDEHFGSVVIILMVVSIVLTCIRILQECNNKQNYSSLSKSEKYNLYGEQIRSFSKNQGWFTKMRIKKVLRRELSPEDYRKYGLRLLSSILTVGENIKDDEVQTLVEASNV